MRALVDPQGGYLRRLAVTNGAGRMIDVLFSHPINAKRATHGCLPFGLLESLVEGVPQKTGLYMVNGQILKLPRHGFPREQHWRWEASREAITLRLSTLSAGNEHILVQYPFACTLSEIVSLEADNTLRFVLGLTRHPQKAIQRFLGRQFWPVADTVPAPVNLAVHTYYTRRPAGLRLLGVDGLPYRDETTEDREARHIFTPADGVLTDATKCDMHFPDLQGRTTTRLVYDEYDVEITKVQGDRAAVLWNDRDEGPFTCWEELMLDRLDQFTQERGMFLYPGQSLTLEFTLRVIFH
ncbi:MAG: hypothetical protein WC901_03140 [Candidatus Margulisiibacteriota bacterium]